MAFSSLFSSLGSVETAALTNSKARFFPSLPAVATLPAIAFLVVIHRTVLAGLFAIWLVRRKRYRANRCDQNRKQNFRVVLHGLSFVPTAVGATKNSRVELGVQKRLFMFAKTQTGCLEGTDAQPIRQRSDDIRLALALTYITLGWMTIEGAAALLLGWASKSLLLEAFGIDSVIELFSAAVLLWRLRVEASGTATSEHVNLVERRAARLVGYSLYVLVAYVVLNSGYGLFIAKRITDTHESVWGILIGAVAKVGMPVLAGYKLKIAARLNSRALRADAVESITCGYLSIVLMIGLAATRLLGWWWLDSVAALALIPFLITEARAAVCGECDCGEAE